MVLPCGLQEKTLVRGEASLEHKQELWLRHDAKPAWTLSKDPPSLAMHRLQEHPSFPTCMEPCPSIAHSMDLAGTRSHCQVVVGFPLSHGVPGGQCGSARWGHFCVLLHISI